MTSTVRKTRRPGERVDRYLVRRHFWESVIAAESRSYRPLAALCAAALTDLRLGDGDRPAGP